MSYQLTLLNTKQGFDVGAEETLLDALLRQGVDVRYGCRRGKCATCKHYIVDGDYDNSGASVYALLDEEREEGLTLLCQTFALSDCSVELVEAEAAENRLRPARPRQLQGLVTSCRPLGDRLWSVKLSLSAGLHALPGQYVEVEAPGQPDVTRTFSVASAPFDVKALELIVRAHGGVFSGALDSLTPGMELAVSGPYGQAYLRPTGRPAVLIGDETGISPLLGMTRYAVESGWGPGMRVFHVVPAGHDAAYEDELKAWAGEDAGFSYDRAETVAAAVAQAASGDDIDVYLAGSPDFCDQAVFLLEARGVDTSQLYAERFFAAQ